jgi:hypothetical protein
LVLSENEVDPFDRGQIGVHQLGVDLRGKSFTWTTVMPDGRPAGEEWGINEKFWMFIEFFRFLSN